ncbi:tyrosine-type recombinase/integrase [Sporohalobacter salinus]|uniref:tyrosine-type recombinase/integrase n=1 Tax=Sporohalobacter salinus TaxID=1494606 RepID=UPI0019611C7F|nr:tyrosine-type recombinase/integrase [Sporohalobacter salinus]MBM7625121.1 integrase [Sporohalobacter salinus]
MAKVEPIRDKKKITTIINLLKGKENWRDYVLFVLGINFGLRIGDLLRVQVKNVREDSGYIKDSFEIKEQKTGKYNSIEINQAAKETLELLFEKTKIGENPTNYLIYNTQSYPLGSEAISRVQAYRLIRKWCKQVGLTSLNIGTHTLRKTFGYHAWKNGINIEALQEKFKHESTSTTREYLGIEKKDVKETYHSLDDIF